MLILDKQRALERIMALMGAVPEAEDVAAAVLHEGAAMTSPRRARRRAAANGPRIAAWGLATPADDPVAASVAAVSRRERRRRQRRIAGDTATAT